VENNSKFKFGRISQHSTPTGKQPRKPRQRKTNIVVRNISNPIDSIRCKQRVKDLELLCKNEYCKCDYKESKIDDLYLEINRLKIIEYINDDDHRKSRSEYLNYMLSREWKSDKLNNKYGELVYDFIKQCRYVYDLDLLIKRKKKEKVNTATEAVNCNDRKKSKTTFCKGCKINNEKYLCFYSQLTVDGVNKEVLREYFISKVKKDLIPEWDKIILTFHWYSLTKKQETLVNHFISRHKYLLPNNPNTNIILITPTITKQIKKTKSSRKLKKP